MSYEQVVDQIVKILNTPTCIAGVTIGSLLLFFLVLLTRTSIGKKALNTLRDKITSANKSLSDATQTLIEVKTGIEEYKELKDKEIKEIKDAYEIKLVGAKQQLEKQEQLLKVVAENVHNGKVQKELNAYIEDTKNKATEEVNEIIETEKEKARSEYENELATLRHEIKELKKMSVETKNECENIVKDTKETITEVVEDVKGE